MKFNNKSVIDQLNLKNNIIKIKGIYNLINTLLTIFKLSEEGPV